MASKLSEKPKSARTSGRLPDAARKAEAQLNALLAGARVDEGACQAVLDALPSPVFVKDTEGVYLACNVAFERFVGRSREEILGRGAQDLWPEDLAQHYADKDGELLEAGGRQVYEGRVQFADGTIHDVVFNKSTFDDADGSLGGIVGVLVDISERRETERQLEDWLRLNAERLRQLECLHGLSQLITRKLSPERFLPAAAWLVQASREARGCVGVHFGLDGEEFDSPGFASGECVLSEEFELEAGHSLRLEAHYDAGAGEQVSSTGDEARLVRSVIVQAGAYLDRYLAEEGLRRHIGLESAVARISSRFASAPDLDRALEETLGDVAREVGASRANLHAYDDDFGRPVKVVEWCAAGVASVKEQLAKFDLGRYPWWHEKMRSGEIVMIGSVDELPAAARAEREAIERLGSGSVLAVPLIHDGELRGFAGFSTVNRLASWSARESAILRVFGELASRAILRAQRGEKIVRLATAVQQSSDGIIIADLDGTIAYVNPAVEQMTGYVANELLGREIKEFVPTDDEHNRHPSLWTSVRQGLPWHGRLRLARRDGTPYFEDCKVSPIRNSGGRIGGFLAIKRDITEQVQMEKQLRQAQKLESIGQLAAGIAHEINTPSQYVGDNARFLQGAFGDLGGLVQELLTVVEQQRAGTPVSGEQLEAIRDRIEQADTEFLLEEIPSAITQSLEGIDRIRSIVLAMREFSHPGGDRKAPTDLNAGIRNTVTISRNVWKYHCDLQLDLQEELPLVPCDGAEINQAVLNLITNAAHAVKEDREMSESEELGLLKVGTRLDGDAVEISITDNGTGISEEVQERLFDPFFTTKEVGEGTGQGLPIVRNVIVDKHKGRIDVESELGRGTTFRLRLPLS